MTDDASNIYRKVNRCWRGIWLTALYRGTERQVNGQTICRSNLWLQWNPRRHRDGFRPVTKQLLTHSDFFYIWGRNGVGVWRWRWGSCIRHQVASVIEWARAAVYGFCDWIDAITRIRAIDWVRELFEGMSELLKQRWFGRCISRPKNRHFDVMHQGTDKWKIVLRTTLSDRPTDITADWMNYWPTVGKHRPTDWPTAGQITDYLAGVSRASRVIVCWPQQKWLLVLPSMAVFVTGRDNHVVSQHHGQWITRFPAPETASHPAPEVRPTTPRNLAFNVVRSVSDGRTKWRKKTYILKQRTREK